MSEIFSQTAGVSLDASGSGVVVFGPSKYGETWIVNRISTRGSAPKEPMLEILRNGNMIDSTRRGNSAVSENVNLKLRSGEQFVCRYSAGQPTAYMTVYIEGEISRAIS